MIKQGQKVIIEYACSSLADGTDSAISGEQGKRMEFIFGSAQTPPGFVHVAGGIKIGETRTVEVAAEQAYGAYDAALVQSVPLDNVPNADQLPVGEFISVATAFGATRAKVAKIEDDQVYLDFNHELAGQDLICRIKLVDLPGLTGSNIEKEKYLSGTCACGCDELRHALDSGHQHKCDARQRA
jgi:FKBP-type peptidyl-prolyl cis-trans isomerase 2